MRRREARREAFNLLYQIEVGDWQPDKALADFCTRHDPADEEVTFAAESVRGVLSHLAEIDALIAAHAPDWPLDRMPATDRNILRLATYELLHRQEIPSAVAINEAIVLAKRYGTEDSGRFVNGVLGGILKEVQTRANKSVA
mgnify:CR=1 FL=1